MAPKTLFALACIMVSIACCQGQGQGGICSAYLHNEQKCNVQTDQCASGFKPVTVRFDKFMCACVCKEDNTIKVGSCKASYHGAKCTHDVNNCKPGYKPSLYETGGECKCDCHEYGTCSASWKGVECLTQRNGCKKGFSPFPRWSSGTCHCDCREDNSGQCAAYYKGLTCHVERDNCKDGYRAKDYYENLRCKCDCVEKLGSCSASYRWLTAQCGVDRNNCIKGSSPHDYYSKGTCHCDCRK